MAKRNRRLSHGEHSIVERYLRENKATLEAEGLSYAAMARKISEETPVKDLTDNNVRHVNEGSQTDSKEIRALAPNVKPGKRKRRKAKTKQRQHDRDVICCKAMRQMNKSHKEIHGMPLLTDEQAKVFDDVIARRYVNDPWAEIEDDDTEVEVEPEVEVGPEAKRYIRTILHSNGSGI